MELNLEQQEIVTTNKNKVLVSCVAAAGKTRVLTERVKYLINQGVSPYKIVVITFTNAAAEEMRKRIGEKGEKVFIGTIHSYANFLLRAHGINTSSILDEENFDQLFAMIKKHPECIQEVEHLLLDEAQDTDDKQFYFLLNQMCPHSYFLVGDPRQTIYEWKGVNPSALFLIEQEPDVTTYVLNENYRNGRKILAFAKSIIDKLGYDYTDESICASDIIGQVNRLWYDEKAIGRFIKNKGYGDYGSWFVLCRTNSQADYIQSYLESIGVPTDTFKKADLTSEELNKKMTENTVKVITIHTAKGLEADNVIVVDPRMYNAEEVRVSYVAATRAKKNLIWMPIKKTPKKRISSWE